MKLKRIGAIIIILGAIVGTAFYFFDFYSVPDFSMSPTFAQDATVLIFKKNFTISRGSMVLLQSSDNKKIVRRVIGLPGEKIEIKGGGIFIDGKKIETDYVTPTYCSYSQETNAKSVTTLYGEPVSKNDFTNNDTIANVSVDCPTPFVLGADEYFVLGDNVIEAVDSREFGAVSKKHILGRVFKTPLF